MNDDDWDWIDPDDPDDESFAHIGDRAEGHGSGADRGPSLSSDPRVQAGVEHLQRAAREAIAASRALLDVAEELVDDPRAVGDVIQTLGALGALAVRANRPGRSTAHRGGDHRGSGAGDHGAEDHGMDDGMDDDGGDPPVQRIPVS